MSSTNPADTYERYMVPTLFAPWADRLIESASPRAGERVLDVGCGTGIVARKVAARIGSEHVVGLDLNPNMLAVARSVADKDGLAITWTEGRAEELPYPDASFDLVLCQFALMFFADRSAALREMRRVVRDDGRVAIAVWEGLERHPFYETLHRVIERRVGVSSLKDIFALGDAAELRTLLSGAGFRGVELTSITMTARFPNPDAFLAGEIDVDTAAIPAMQHLDAQERAKMTAAIRDEMIGPLRDHTERAEVVIPFHARIVCARR